MTREGAARHPALESVRAMGEELEAKWAEREYAPNVFTELSMAALCQVELRQGLSSSSLLASVAGDAELPEERVRENRVVDEQLTLYRGRHFVIQLLVWIDGITDIHDHQLCGAYLALDGDRIESSYRFRMGESLDDDNVRIGNLEPLGMERVRAGDVRPFVPGIDDLHAVFHLHHPSATLAIRSPRLDVDAGFNYLRPGFAVRTKRSPRLGQRSRALTTLRAGDYPAYAAAVEAALLEAGPLDLFWLFNEHRAAYEGRATELRALLGRLQEERGPWIHPFAKAFAERSRMGLVRSLRQMQRDVDCRLALALILHAQSLDDLPGARAPEVLSALDVISADVPLLRADVQRLRAG